jgi:multicomponent Na+:H+ antiporter subunit D
MINFPPGLILIVGALILLVIPKKWRSPAFLVFPVLAFCWLLLVPKEGITTLPFLGYELMPVRVDQLSLCFGYVFAIITFIGGIFAYHLKNTGEQVSTLIYAGSALCIVFAGDLFTLIFFWEILAISAVYLIWARGTKLSRGAGLRYLMVHLFGGSVLLAGILIYINQTGSIIFDKFDGSIGSCLILFGFCLNAAVPPIHAWLSDAYPEGTVTGSVFLSAFTTKAAVYALLRGFTGWEILIWAGAIMAMYGVFYAVVQNDIRRILAYHIISQVGYMVCGVGIGTAMAVSGVAAHAFTHILYKALLFMGAGSVLYSTGFSKLTDLGGLYKKLPIVFWLYMIGAFSISGFPLFSGFVSKSVVIASAEESHLGIIVLLLYLASVGTFIHTALKLAYFTWFGKDKNLKTEPIPKGMYIGMGLAGLACIVIGVYPAVLYNILPNPIDYHPYTVNHIVNTCLLFIFTGYGFWLFIKILGGERIIVLDTDWFYRRPAKLYYKIFILSVNRAFGYVESALTQVVKMTVRYAANPVSFFMDRTLPAEEGEEVPKTPRRYRDFDPDRYRLSVGIMLLLFMLAFIVALVWMLVAN